MIGWFVRWLDRLVVFFPSLTLWFVRWLVCPMVGWFVVCSLLGWLFCSLVYLFVGWLFYSMLGRFVRWFVCLLVCLLFVRFVRWLVYTGWLALSLVGFADGWLV